LYGAFNEVAYLYTIEGINFEGAFDELAYLYTTEEISFTELVWSFQ